MFPFVGANRYSYGTITNQFAYEVVVYELPGRGLRIKEPLLETFDAIIDDAELFFLTQLGDAKKYSFFGHSLGGLIAFSLCERLQAKGMVLPTCLILSSCSPDYNFRSQKKSVLPSDIFWDALYALGGIALESYENKEFRTFWEPIFKADYACLESRENKSTTQLKIPGLILVGKDEKLSKQNWSERFQEEPDLKQFKGGHFYLFQQNSAVVAYIDKQLKKYFKEKKKRFWHLFTP